MLLNTHRFSLLPCKTVINYNTMEPSMVFINLLLGPVSYVKSVKMHRKALKEVKMPMGESPLTELRVFIELLRPYSTAQKEEKLLKNKRFRFSHIVPSLVQIYEHGI